LLLNLLQHLPRVQTCPYKLALPDSHLLCTDRRFPSPYEHLLKGVPVDRYRGKLAGGIVCNCRAQLETSWELGHIHDEAL
jgi:hypothetical protein